AELEKTMLAFMRHEFDILVCTTIIENGLDIPLANTMIVENAESYGLSALNLGLDIRIPTDYVADENQRLRAYRQIANASDEAARDRAERELADRYGPVPEAVRNLLAYSALKYMAEKIGVEAVDRRHSLVSIKFHTATRVDPQQLMEIVSKTRGAQFTPAGVLLLPLDGRTNAGEILKFLGAKLKQLQTG